MVRCDTEWIEVKHSDGTWSATHDVVGDPGRMTLYPRLSSDTCLRRDYGFYADAFSGDAAVVSGFKARRKAGTAVVQSERYWPLGPDSPVVAEQFAYGGQHVRVTTDVQWPAGLPVERHLGLDSIVLTGEWRRMLIVPTSSALEWGREAEWIDLPQVTEETMVGHWHRPPLAMCFEAGDGVRVEIGVGKDLWRWELALGFGPEAGSYKVFVESDGSIRIVRELVMTCLPQCPAQGKYRFTWYVAWSGHSDGLQGTAERCERLNMGDERIEVPEAGVITAPAQTAWPARACRTDSFVDSCLGRKSTAPCWVSNEAQKRFRRFVRRVAEKEGEKRIVFEGLSPGLCWEPGHVWCSQWNGAAHWDAGLLLELGSWTRQQLGQEWTLNTTDVEGWKQELPSVRGLFLPNGFEA